jgi:predicted dehydrogenase
MRMDDRMRVGVLGASRIVRRALVEPASRRGDVEVVAIAARDEARAAGFAAQHGIARAYGSYEALLADPDVDAVYVALPAALHARFSILALAAGKHVLCEKPFAANAQEAEAMVAAAVAAGRVLAEAFHYHHHPFAAQMRALGAAHLTRPPVHVVARFQAPIEAADDIRRSYVLGGGALMDLGCYAVHWVRTVLREEPAVVAAQATAGDPEGDPEIDEAMSAELVFPSGATAAVACSMARSCRFSSTVRATAPEVSLMFSNPLAPHAGNAIQMTLGFESSTRTIAGDATYDYQLAAFVEAVCGGAAMPTSGADSIANMRAIDAIYRAAGLRLRGGA